MSSLNEDSGFVTGLDVSGVSLYLLHMATEEAFLKPL